MIYDNGFWLLTDFSFLNLPASHKLSLINIYYLLKMDSIIYSAHLSPSDDSFHLTIL